MPESTLVSLAVFHLGIFGARIVLDSTVDIVCAKVVKDYYRHHGTQEEMTNLKIIIIVLLLLIDFPRQENKWKMTKEKCVWVLLEKNPTLHQRCRALQSTEQPPIDWALHQPSCENAWFDNMEGLNIYPVRLWFVIIKTSRIIINVDIVHFLCICNSTCIIFLSVQNWCRNMFIECL